MNEARRRILSHCRIAKALISPQISRPRSSYSQVTHSANFSVFCSVRSPNLIKFNSYARILFFSSAPASLLDIFSSDDWSNKLDKEVANSNLVLNHETVIYVLKKLSKDPKKASGFFNGVVKKNGFELSSSIYSLMLRIYASKDFMKEFWLTIKEMKEKGYYIDEETYKSILSIFRGLKMEKDVSALKHFYARLMKENAMEDCVKVVVDVIKTGKWEERVEKELGLMELQRVVSDNFVLRVLKELRGKGHGSKAYRFFKWVEQSLGFEHGTVTYNGVLRVLCWEESIFEFWTVFEEMKNAGFELDFDTYIKISRQLQKNKMLEDAVRLYEHMMDSSYKPSFKESNILLRTLATYRMPNLDLVNRVVNKFEESGYIFTKNIYDGIHRCLTNLGKFEEAKKIVETMRNAGFEPDNVTYSQLVFGLCKAGKFDEASEVVNAMEEEHGCVPDIKTWTILIKGFSDGNKIDDGLVCFGKMMEKGCDPDADLLDVLVNGFLSRGRAIGGYKLVVELVGKLRVVPWQSTYKNLIEKLLMERKLEEGMEVLRMMKKHNYPGFIEPFVEYVSKYGSVEEALELLRVLGGKEKYASLSVYRNVFKSMFEEGRHSEANDLLFKCPYHVRKHPGICQFFHSGK